MQLEPLINRAGTALVGAYMHLALDLDIEQYEDLPPGPKIIAANHPTTTDPFYLLPLINEPMSILVSEIAFKAPMFGSYLHAAGHIPVMREHGRDAYNAALDRLRAGGTVGIFPEGSTEPWDGSARKASTGAIRLALESGAPVIPVGIALDPEHIRYRETTFDDMSDLARWYIDGPYAITIGGPRRATGSLEDREHVHYLSDSLMAIIYQLEHESADRLRRRRTVGMGDMVKTLVQMIPRLMVEW